MLYDIFLSEIIPAYYSQNQEGVSETWCNKMKSTIADILPHYTMKRQLDDYYSKFYCKMFEQTALLEKDNAAKAGEYALWKHRIKRFWNAVRPIELNYPDSEREAMDISNKFCVEVVLQISELKAEEIGVELLIADKQNEKINTYTEILPFELVEKGQNTAKYSLVINSPVAGVHDYAIRVYPHCDLMLSRQDFPLVKWI